MYTENHIENPEAYERGKEASIRANASITRNRKWLAEDASRKDVAKFVREYSHTSDFMNSVFEGLEHWGRLSKGQEAAVRKIMQKQKAYDAAKAAEYAAAAECPEGRVQVTGTILSVKLVDNGWGAYSIDKTWKMLVRDDSGFKVWGTIPTKLMEQTELFVTRQIYDNRSLKGQRVTFAAATQPSDDDSKFGFFKRPTKAQLLGEQHA
jgi:hypothetical protein